jgi:hypothetical protein
MKVCHENGGMYSVSDSASGMWGMQLNPRHYYPSDNAHGVVRTLEDNAVIGPLGAQAFGVKPQIIAVPTGRSGVDPLLFDPTDGAPIVTATLSEDGTIIFDNVSLKIAPLNLPNPALQVDQQHFLEEPLRKVIGSAVLPQRNTAIPCELIVDANGHLTTVLPSFLDLPVNKRPASFFDMVLNPHLYNHEEHGTTKRHQDFVDHIELIRTGFTFSKTLKERADLTEGKQIPIPLPKQQGQRRKTIIFDLDETLIHCLHSTEKPSDHLVTALLPNGDSLTVHLPSGPCLTESLD